MPLPPPRPDLERAIVKAEILPGPLFTGLSTVNSRSRVFNWRPNQIYDESVELDASLGSYFGNSVVITAGYEASSLTLTALDKNRLSVLWQKEHVEPEYRRLVFGGFTPSGEVFYFAQVVGFGLTNRVDISAFRTLSGEEMWSESVALKPDELGDNYKLDARLGGQMDLTINQTQAGYGSRVITGSFEVPGLLFSGFE